MAYQNSQGRSFSGSYGDELKRDIRDKAVVEESIETLQKTYERVQAEMMRYIVRMLGGNEKAASSNRQVQEYKRQLAGWQKSIDAQKAKLSILNKLVSGGLANVAKKKAKEDAAAAKKAREEAKRKRDAKGSENPLKPLPAEPDKVQITDASAKKLADSRQNKKPGKLKGGRRI